MNPPIGFLDRTDQAYDPLLTTAALFEGDFSVDWLVDLTGYRPSEVLAVLEETVAKGWLAKLGPAAYNFVDSIKKQEYHDVLSKKQENLLHEKIADLLIRELPDDDQKPQVLAAHLLNIPTSLDRARWLVRAGDCYRHSFHNEKALRCYAKALEDLPGLGGLEVDRFYIESAIKYSKISTARLETTTVLQVLDQALDRADKWQLESDLALLKMHQAKNEWLRSHYHTALKHFEEGWSLAKSLGDPKLLRSATVFSTFFLYWQGRFQEVVDNYEQAVSEVQRYPQGGFPLLAALTVGHCYAQIGQITQGLGMLDTICKQCRAKGNNYLAAHSGVMVGAGLLEIRDIDNALLHLEPWTEESSKERNEWAKILGLLMLALAYFLKAEKKKSLATLRQVLQTSTDVRVTVRPYPYLMELCWAMEEKKLPRLPEVSLQEEINRALEDNNVFMKGIAHRYEAFLQRRAGLGHETIIRSFQHSLENLEISGHQIEMAKTRLEMARQYLSAGKNDRARDLAAQAAAVLTRFNEALIPDDLRCLLKDSPVRYDPLAEILNLSKELTTIRVHKNLVQHIVSTVNRITGAERGAIFLLEEEGGRKALQLRASKNLTMEQVSDQDFSSSWKIIEEVTAKGRGKIVGKNYGSPENPANGEVIRSRICVPMVLKDKVVGVLYHDNRLLDNAFRESDLELLAYFASQAAFALDNARAYEEIRRLNQKLKEEKEYYEEQHLQSIHFEDIVGESQAIKMVLAQIGRVAHTDTTVIILGETGVGKELVARAIHRHSPRHDKPFIRVHCSALPETLIPSELFGHERGAFTGATNRKIGRFELADGGTLFLDEIGDLTLEMQVRLLRVLQTKEFERVGGNETIRSDFRLVTATNRDLENDVKAKRFRADLYYRTNVFPIYVPPLRERKEDIHLLVYYFLSIYAKKVGKTFGRIPDEEMEKLTGYDWPGNVRELENIIERGVILSPGPAFRAPELRGDLTKSPYARDGAVTLEENEKRHILWALRQTDWKVRGPQGAAELLKIHPSTLNFRMKKLGIRRPT